MPDARLARTRQVYDPAREWSLSDVVETLNRCYPSIARRSETMTREDGTTVIVRVPARFEPHPPNKSR